MNRWLIAGGLGCFFGLLALACGSSDSEGAAGASGAQGGQAGQAGEGGTAGQGGMAGQGGEAGQAGQAGNGGIGECPATTPTVLASVSGVGSIAAFAGDKLFFVTQDAREIQSIEADGTGVKSVFKTEQSSLNQLWPLIRGLVAEGKDLVYSVDASAGNMVQSTFVLAADQTTAVEVPFQGFEISPDLDTPLDPYSLLAEDGQVYRLSSDYAGNSGYRLILTRYDVASKAAKNILNAYLGNSDWFQNHTNGFIQARLALAPDALYVNFNLAPSADADPDKIAIYKVDKQTGGAPVMVTYADCSCGFSFAGGLLACCEKQVTGQALSLVDPTGTAPKAELLKAHRILQIAPDGASFLVLADVGTQRRLLRVDSSAATQLACTDAAGFAPGKSAVFLLDPSASQILSLPK